jgi:L-alanine-DL-glutamate epimerase-like enolase superfamily enzyme
MAPEAATDEAELLLQRGFKTVKLRLGYSDLAGAVTRAARARLSDTVEIFVDYNQALDPPRGPQARARARTGTRAPASSSNTAGKDA